MRRHADRVTDAHLHHRTVRRRMLTGAGAALLAGGLAAAGEPAGAAPSARTNLMYYWVSDQQSLGYSQAVQVGDTVWLSGTASLDPQFNPVHPDDLAAQMAFIYQRIGETLNRFGLGFRHVVRENMYVTDMAALINALPYRKSIYGSGPFPTSTTVQVNQLLLPGLMIEIETTACRA
ncbi:RidA family protein [Dactylosporangium sp. CA-139066]|uniref:RidA family protein n=1 Tax=Dactylosporangium sp. CA-139066 TaxID=3239930 RepID=UPI003D8B3E47